MTRGVKSGERVTADADERIAYALEKPLLVDHRGQESAHLEKQPKMLLTSLALSDVVKNNDQPRSPPFEREGRGTDHHPPACHVRSVKANHQV